MILDLSIFLFLKLCSKLCVALIIEGVDRLCREGKKYSYKKNLTKKSNTICYFKQVILL